MKRISLLLSVSFFTYTQGIAQVKIGTNPATINNAALLELESSNKGLLLPRMVNTNMRSIPAPPAGLMVYNITDSAIYFRRDTGWTLVVTPSRCAFRLHLATNNEVPSGVFVYLVPFSISYDEGKNYTEGAFKAKEAGVYHFEMSIIIESHAADFAFAVETLINNTVSEQKYRIVPSSTAGYISSLEFSFNVKLNVNDTYDFAVFTSSALTVIASSGVQRTYFSGFKIL